MKEGGTWLHRWDAHSRGNVLKPGTGWNGNSFLEIHTVKQSIKNINTLYQGEFPLIDEAVSLLGNFGAEPEYWGVRPTDDDPLDVDRPYAYLLITNQMVAFKIHQLAEAAMKSGFAWSLWAFFPGEAGLKTTATDRQVDDLRYCLELNAMPPAKASNMGWLEYRTQACNFLIQSLKAKLGEGGLKSGESAGIGAVR